MRILYVASGIPLPGSLGGSTHTLEVARGLAARGHSVHVIAAAHENWAGPAALVRPVSFRLANFTLHQIDIPKIAAILTAPLILRLARAIQPDAVIERYYNFAGGGLLAARRLGVPSLLEVNALIVDPPEVRKRRLDDALGGPMRRWATAQCRMAARIVTPLHTTVPAEIDRAKIVELPWGAAVERFVPLGSGGAGAATNLTPLGWGGAGAATNLTPLGWGGAAAATNLTSSQNLDAAAPPQPPTILFLGSFRAWHGVLDFVQAAGLLLQRGVDAQFLLVGDGPERAAAERAARAFPGRFRFTGAVPYEAVPALLATASVGVAPFNTAPHPALRAAGFFWSPLKIYEYMAAGLPVVTADIAPLNQVIRAGQEGLLYPEGAVPALAEAVAQLLADPATARAMGLRARERVVADYSWAAHCAALEQVLLAMVG